MAVEELYEQKYGNFMKAVNRQEGAYVPNVSCNNGGGFFWKGNNILNVPEGDRKAYAEILTKVLDEMWIDANVISGVTTTLRQDRAFPTAENRIAKDGTMTHLQVSPMKQDEYDQLIANPVDFIANVLLPRKHAFLYEDRNVAKEALKVYAEESFSNYIQQIPTTNKLLAEKYGVYSFVNIGLMVNTPLDHLFDFFRGFRGTLTDLRRQPENVKAALDAIWEYRWADKVSRPYDAAAGYPFQPCHIPAYLSPKQYKELYWPYEKKLIEWIYNSGSKVFLIMEGRWKQIWDCFLDVPKDSCVLYVDDDDFLEVNAALGHHQILCGGLKMADTRLKNIEDIKEDIKRLIDTCAPGGGFLFATDKGWLTPGDVNQTLVDAFNFAHEYSSK